MDGDNNKRTTRILKGNDLFMRRILRLKLGYRKTKIEILSLLQPDSLLK